VFKTTVQIGMIFILNSEE